MNFFSQLSKKQALAFVTSLYDKTHLKDEYAPEILLSLKPDLSEFRQYLESTKIDLLTKCHHEEAEYNQDILNYINCMWLLIKIYENLGSPSSNDKGGI